MRLCSCVHTKSIYFGHLLYVTVNFILRLNQFTVGWRDKVILIQQAMQQPLPLPHLCDCCTESFCRSNALTPLPRNLQNVCFATKVKIPLVPSTLHSESESVSGRDECGTVKTKLDMGSDHSSPRIDEQEAARRRDIFAAEWAKEEAELTPKNFPKHEG